MAPSGQANLSILTSFWRFSVGYFLFCTTQYRYIICKYNVFNSSFFQATTRYKLNRKILMISYPGWCQKCWYSWWTWSSGARLPDEDLPASRDALCCPTAPRSMISYKACWVTKTRCGCPCQKLQMLLPNACIDAHLGREERNFLWNRLTGRRGFTHTHMHTHTREQPWNVLTDGERRTNAHERHTQVSEMLWQV